MRAPRVISRREIVRATIRSQSAKHTRSHVTTRESRVRVASQTKTRQRKDCQTLSRVQISHRSVTNDQRPCGRNGHRPCGRKVHRPCGRNGHSPCGHNLYVLLAAPRSAARSFDRPRGHIFFLLLHLSLPRRARDGVGLVSRVGRRVALIPLASAPDAACACPSRVTRRSRVLHGYRMNPHRPRGRNARRPEGAD
jgi:hypothetical protein